VTLRRNIPLLLCITAAAAIGKPAETPDPQWWSLQPLKVVAPPPIPAGGRNEIDAFLAARLAAEGRTFSPEAPRAVLLRRAAFDLTGLPPSPDELATFEKASGDSAFAIEVDRLLASPGYGEKWARHWLDIARYGESDGFEFDKPRPDAWRYRDWVVRALNADMPYQEFARWQIAGDLLAPDDPDAVTAAAFLVCGPYDDTNKVTSSENLRKVMRQDELEDIVGTTGQVFLGLTLHCARCHDHKFDPVSLREYYQIASCFAGVDRGKRELPARSGLCFTVMPKEAPVVRVLDRGSALKPVDAVRPGGIAALAGVGPDFQLSENAPEADRRRALAQWITHPDNPLFARTIVNRVWHWHFGRGLVATPSDLGKNGGHPAHPELLDWLAHRFRSDGWSLKKLHRLILISAAWRQSSAGNGPAALYARMERRRLTSEELRDAMLAAAGALIPSSGGPPYMDFRMENKANTMHYHPEDRDAPEVNRRSLYRMWARGGPQPLLNAFDCPDTSVSTPARSTTTTPLNALALLNSPFTFAMAERLAGRLTKEAGGSLTQQITRLFLLTAGRAPAESERAACHSLAEKHGLAAVCRVAMNANAFLTIE
jgi:Protein of unknown function (DUF1553)/Protein of unknown function (DUF1549)